MNRSHSVRACQHRRKNTKQQHRRLTMFFKGITKYKENANVVILTGAGISAESGLATFRAEGGLWDKHRVDDVATFAAFQRDPYYVQQFYNARRAELFKETVQPNAAHYALAELEAILGDKFLLVTQNIDNLHERAGNKRIIHMHGELLKVRCTLSGKVFEWSKNITSESHCDCCYPASPLRPHIVWFGEMPLEMARIYQAIEQASYFIAIGTSGNVYPAASFVSHAHENNAHTVELNLEKSLVESQFDEHHYGLASVVVPEYIKCRF